MAQLKIQALPSGAHIGVYEIKDVLSSDWSGILYRAWNEHLNSMVALKEYLPSDYAVKAKFSKDDSVYEYGMKKFLELAERLADIQQPNVVNVHNILQCNKTSYLAMGFVEGTPLSKLQDYSLTFTDEKAKQILKSLLNALQAVHDNNIIHGNVTPSNIIIGENGEPVLVNFASANIALSEHIKQTQHRSTPGFRYTKNYHPGDLSSPSSDLYSLGATMFYCITGKEPIAFLNRKKALKKNWPDPCQTALEQLKNRFSEELLKTIRWMLNPDPKQRPQAAHEVLTKLDHKFDASEEQVDEIPILYKEKPRAGMLLFGLTGFIGLIVCALWLYRQLVPTTITSNIVKNVKQPIAETELTKKISSEQTAKRLVIVPPVIDSKVQEVEKSPDNLHADNSEIFENQETEIEENFFENLEIFSQFVPLEDQISNDQENEKVKLTAEQDAKIELHLAAAKKNVNRLNLTTPLDENAFDQYQAVLEIEPDNLQAREGLHDMFQIYTWIVVKAIKKRHFKEAHLYLRRMEALEIKVSYIQELRNELISNVQQWDFLQEGQNPSL